MNLFLLGLLTTAAGFIAIGFGIPVHSFSFGNTLIVAGVTAVVGGFILIGLSAVVRQLKRIADGSVSPGASLPAPNSGADPFEAQARFIGSMKPEASPRQPASVEPKLAAAPPSAEPDTAIAWLRPKNGEPTLGERAVIEEFEASLAPQTPRPASPPSAPTPARAPEPRPWTPLGPSEPATPSRAEVARPDRTPAGPFDAVWPASARSAETIERARRPETGKSAREERAPKDAQAPAATAEEPRPVAILKSGMIDGMAYTLFADGSIEAVLATGPIRFASVEALRAHLEKNG